MSLGPAPSSVFQSSVFIVTVFPRLPHWFYVLTFLWFSQLFLLFPSTSHMKESDPTSHHCDPFLPVEFNLKLSGALWRNVWSSQKIFNWWLERIHAWVIKLVLLRFLILENIYHLRVKKLVIDKCFDVVTCKKNGDLKWTLVHVWDSGFKAIQ